MVYLQCDEATRPSLVCDGLVCIPVPGWVNVLNPSTGELLKFPSGGPSHYDDEVVPGGKKLWWNVFPGNWTMGFGRDKVNGSYKVVRMLFDPNHQCEILDLNIGEWRKLNPLPYKIETKRKSACVNGSIYWLNLYRCFTILALDLHTEEFRDVPVPPPMHTTSTQIVNLQDRLAVATATPWFDREWKLLIWTLDAQEERWSMTYSISLSHPLTSKKWWNCCFTPLTLSKKGSLYFYDGEKQLFKYCPDTGLLICLSQDICVISPFVENLVPLRPKISRSGYRCGGLSYID